MGSEIITVDQEILSLKGQFESVCTDKSISFEKEAEFAIQVISANSYLLQLANANRQALRDAVTNVAAIGISLNPARKQAYLVPRKGKICLDISYFGMVDMALNSGSIKWVQSGVVYEQDQFTLNGFDRPPVHEFKPFAKDRGAIVGAYTVAKTADGEYLTHTMSIDAVYAIRDRSEAWKGGKACPWRSDEVEMIRKTVVKQASKMWPKTERLQQAVHYLNTDGGEGIDFEAEKEELKDDERPLYPDDKFEKNFPDWEALVVSGKKTAKGMLATLSSKVRLTEKQKKAIENINVIEG